MIDLLKHKDITPEQLKIIKEGLSQALQESLMSRGVRGENGKVIPKYAFMKKRQIKKMVIIRTWEVDGRKIYIRMFR